MPTRQPLPGSLQLALRLRQLRQQWPEVRLTQETLARAFATEEQLSAVTVSSWESTASPKLPPQRRLLAYARFFATRRSVEQDPPCLLPLDDLTKDEKDVYRAIEAELLGLRDSAERSSIRDEIPLNRTWLFPDEGPVTLICAQLPRTETGPRVDLTDPNYTELLSYADLDALMELHGHIRAQNPAMNVFFKSSDRVVPDDVSGHIVLLGGIGWNEFIKHLSDMTALPVKQTADPEVGSGEIFVLNQDGTERRFLPKWDDEYRVLAEDVGLVARTSNPHNSGRTLTICGGIHSRGVLGAVRVFTDARLREGNERYIAENFADPSRFAILMRVQIIKGMAVTPDLRLPDCILYQWP
jgi:hypothetical protein